MSTVRELVTKGMREGGILEVGGTPEAEEFEECLSLLQDLYSSFFGNELGEQLTTENYGTQGLTNSYALAADMSSYIDTVYVPTNIRLIFNVSGAKTLYLHPNPMDGARLGVIDNAGNLSTNPVTLDGNGRMIESAANVVLNTNSINREWFYRADLGGWTKVSDLDADDISPLPREFDTLFSTALALRINPRYGADTNQNTVDVLLRARRQFRARYRQTMPTAVEDGLIRLSSNPYWPASSGKINSFDKGR